MSHPLDRAVWTALTTLQRDYGVGGPLARRFHPEIGPICASRDGSPEALAALGALIEDGEELALVEPDPPAPPPGFAETLHKPILQMTARAITPGKPSSHDIVALGDADAAEMLALATLTKPGPFRAKTHTLGRFLGVREKGVLIAMAGERMRLDGFIEVSAVCTHPDHVGRGLGAVLMRAAAGRILSEGATVFLHCYDTNISAVGLYEKLGFETRAKLLHVAWARA